MSGASPVSVPAARCVLWHPIGSPPPNDLLDALQRRGLAWTATDRILTAIVRTLTPLPASTAPLPIPSVLVCIDPPRLRSLDNVLDVVARYRPRTALWVFDLADPSRLKSMQALEIIAKYAPHKSEDRPGSTAPTTQTGPESVSIASGWRLQLTGPNAEPNAPMSAPRPDSPPAGPAASSAFPTSALRHTELRSATDSMAPEKSGFRSVVM